MNHEALRDWQRRLAAQQTVWTVFCGEHDTGNLYDSQEAAELEASWRRSRGQRARAEALGQLHDFVLSTERWATDARKAAP